MRILLTTDTVGGVWQYTMALVGALPEHQFTVVTLGQPPSPQQREALQARAEEVIETSWKLEWMEGAMAELTECRQWFEQLAQRLTPNIIHLNGYALAGGSYEAPVVVVGHSCVLTWWKAVKGEAAPSEWEAYRDAVTAGLRGADRVVAPTHSFLAQLRGCYGSFAPARVIYNASACQLVELGARREEVVLAAGRAWDEAKNLRVLNAVASDLPWRVQVAGDTHFENETVALQHVELLGKLDADGMANAMKQSRIWAHPALYEPFGLAVLEAAEKGCALVLGDIDTLRELWDGSALFVDPHDVAGWRQALTELCRDGGRVEQMAKAAQARAACYSGGRFEAGYRSLYAEIAGGAG